MIHKCIVPLPYPGNLISSMDGPDAIDVVATNILHNGRNYKKGVWKQLMVGCPYIPLLIPNFLMPF